MKSTQIKSDFLKGTFYVFIIKILGAGLAFLSQVLLSKSLGMEAYGSLSIFLSIANILIVLPLIGMDTSIIRSVAGVDVKSQKKWFLNITIKITALLLGIIVLLVVNTREIFLSIFNLKSELGIFLIIYVIIMCYSKILDGFLQGEKKTVIANVFSPLSNNLLKIVMLGAVFSFTREILSAVIVIIIVELILLILRVIYIGKDYFRIKSHPTPNDKVIDYMKYSIPLFFVASIGIIQVTLDKIILSFMMGNFEVGVLRVFENYAVVLALFVTPFATMWPLMSEYYKKNKMEELKGLFKQSTILVSTLILPAWITLTICTEEIMGIFGIDVNEIDNIRLIMFLFFLGTVYDAIIGPAGALLNMTKYSRVNLYNNVLLLILNVLLNFILIPKIGLLGAAIAFSASKIFINSLNVLQNKRLFNLFPYGKIHLVLIIIGIPFCFLGIAFKELLNAGIIINIVSIGFLMYLLYFVAVILIYKGKILKLIKKF